MRNLEKALPNLKRQLTTLTVALIGTIVLFLTGCKTNVPSHEKIYITKMDSILVKETISDTVIKIKADSSSILALLECDSLGKVRLREILSLKASGRISPPMLRVKNNVMYVQAKIDTMSIYLSMKNRVEKHVANNTNSNTKICTIYKQRTWQKILCWSGALGWIAVLGCLMLKLYQLTRPAYCQYTRNRVK